MRWCHAYAAGLHVRLLDGTELFPEEQMSDGELLVYAGDALSCALHNPSVHSAYHHSQDSRRFHPDVWLESVR